MDTSPPLYVVAGPMDHPHDADTFAASMAEPSVSGATINATLSQAPDFADFMRVYDLTPIGTTISATLASEPAPDGVPTVTIGGAVYPDLMDPGYPAASIAAHARFFDMLGAEGIDAVGAFRLCLISEGDGQGQFGLKDRSMWPGPHFTSDGVVAAVTAVVQGLAQIPAAAGATLWVSFFDPNTWLGMATATLTAIKANWPGRVLYVGTVFRGTLSAVDGQMAALCDGGGIQLSDTGIEPAQVPEVYAAAVALVPPVQVIECHHGQPEALGAAV